MLAPSWPDWTGETAVIVATGPSAKHADLEQVRGYARFIAIKSSWQLCPWADVLYGVDRQWWMANNGAPEFRGLKVSASPTVCRVYPGVRQVKLKSQARVLTGVTGVVGCGLRTGGGHSGFQAINLAVQFGVTRIALVGFDMHLNNGAHWHKEGHGVGKADAKRTNQWREEMDPVAEQFERMGIEVINTSMDSALKAYRKMPLPQAVWNGG